MARLDLMDAADAALLEADLATADQRIRQLEASLGCGSLAESELLGRLWLVEAAWLSLSGDPQAAMDSWRAAARMAPGHWVDGYGQVLRDQYEDAIEKVPPGVALLSLDPPLFKWIGAVDGAVTEFPAKVAPGLHLVQVGADPDHLEFARAVTTFAGTPTVVRTGISEPSDFVAPAQPNPPRKPPKKRREPLPAAVASLYTAAGVHLAIGKEVTQGADVQPGAKFLFPVETGVVIRPHGAWVRVAGLAAPLVGGVLLYDDKYGATATPVALGGTVAGGLVAQQGDIGLMVGYAWPDRVPVRAVVAVRTPRFPLQVEGRLGMDVALAGTPEPAFELAFALTPGLFRRED